MQTDAPSFSVSLMALLAHGTQSVAVRPSSLGWNVIFWSSRTVCWQCVDEGSELERSLSTLAPLADHSRHVARMASEPWR